MIHGYQALLKYNIHIEKNELKNIALRKAIAEGYGLS